MKSIFLSWARVLCLILSGIFFSNTLLAQGISVPRDGYPYCEPFTNSTARPNTIFGGSATLTGTGSSGDGVLRLTSNANNQRGYVYIDLPFSFIYGLKFSFEYFSYGGTTTPTADGLSVFLFDGSSNFPFQIGGEGGSLSYAPLVDPPKDQPGLRRAYMGIGFDEFYNFGNNYEGKNGSFLNPLAPAIPLGAPPEAQYYNSVAVRGPENPGAGFLPYQFITGKRVNNGTEANADGPPPGIILPSTAYLYPDAADAAKRFPIATSSRVLECTEDGYRKVFVDLKPTGFKNYLLSVYMLVNTASEGLRVETIVKDVPYNFPNTPDNLKLGFAASTGSYNNYHEIRNVVVEVSDLLAVPLPIIENLSAEICEGDQNLFEFDVTLPSENSFVRCVQLFEVPPTPPYNTPATPDMPTIADCGFSDGACDPVCKPENNTVLLPNKGTFSVVLDENVDIDDQAERIKAAIIFTPDPAGFVGTATIYYQVVDNYGLFSEPKQIVIVSNPYPKELDRGVIEYPSCDRQGDGSISGVIVGDLVPGFDYSWSWTTGSGTTDLDKTGAIVSPGSSADEFVFSLSGVNIGTYTLTVWNPSDEGGCPLVIDIPVTQENGTPVELVSDEVEVCEGTPAILEPFLDPKFLSPPGNTPVFLWYQNPDKTGQLLDGQSFDISGATVTVSIDAQGTLTLTGLPPANDTDPETYEFFVQVQENRSNPTAPNFCPFLGDILSSGKITIFPALDITTDITPDWCRVGDGSISVTAIGGNGNKTFILYDFEDQTTALQTQTEPSLATFSGLLPGDYLVEIESSDPTCLESIPVTVDGPADDLFITYVDETPATCEEDNGTIEFEIGGGNGPLTASSLTITGGPFIGPVVNGSTGAFSGLAPSVPYTITVTDAQGCTETLSFTIEEVQKPVFSITGPAAACEDQTEVIFSVTYDFFEVQATAVPFFNWYNQENGGTALTSGPDPSGMTYAIDNATGTLILTNLNPGTYDFWLEMTGPDACNLDRQLVELVVNPLPEADFAPQDVSCFGGSDGTLSIIGTPVGTGPFSYDLIRVSDNSVQQTNVDGDFSNVSAGDYFVRITNTSTSCSFETSVYTLVEPTPLEISDVEITPTTCGVDDNGAIEFTLSGGTAPYSFVSISRNGIDQTALTPNNVGTTYTFTGLQEGEYVFEFEDANGCTLEETETVTTVPEPEISLSADPEYCFGEEITIAATITEVGTLQAPITYTWVAGSVTLSGTSGNFAGGTYTITPASGITPPNLVLQDIDVADYTFTLQVRGDSSCDLDFSIAIQVNPLPETDFEVEDALCFNGLGTISLISGGQPGYTYTLSNGDSNTDGLFTDLPAGDYTIVVTNSFDCTQTLIRTITQPDELRITNDNSTDPTCGASNGQISFDVLGGTKAYEISINGTPLTAANFDFTLSVDTYTISNLAPGTYTIAVIDGNSCPVEATDLFELVNNDGFDIDSQPIETQLCEGGIALLVPDLTIPAGATPQLDWYRDANATQQITSSATPASDGFIYQITGSRELNISNLTEGNYTYYLKISGPNICESITEASVTVVAPIEATATTTPVTCFGEADGSITVDPPTGGSGTYEFSLNGTVWQASPLFVNLTAGPYTVFVRDDSGDNGCEIQIPNLEVESPAGPISETQGVELPVSCGLENGAVRDVLVTGGWGNYTVEWRKDNAVSGTLLPQGTLTGIEDLAAGTYFLIITDELGCVQIFEYEIGTASDPTYALVPPIDSCFGSPLEIRPIHLAPDPSAPPVAATEILWYKEPNQVGLITSGPDSADPTITYTVNDSDWLNPILEIENLPVGTHDFYFYVVCTGQEMPIQITVFDTPAVVFETEPVLCFGDSNGKIKSVSGVSPEYTYTVNGGSPISLAELEALGFAAGTYNVQVITPAGCPQVINLEVEGPSGALEITVIEQKDPSCAEENGEIQLQLSGGNPPYTLTMNGVAVTGGFDPTLDGALVSFANLAGGTYLFSLEDANNCSPASLSITLDPLEVPEFDASGAEICAFDPATGAPNSAVLSPIIVNQAGSSPIFTWYYRNASGNEIQINSGAAVLGGVAQINATGELTLTGVTAADDPYTFYLEVTGDLVCPAPKIEVELKVNFTPEVVFAKTDILCYGDATGSIAAESGQLPGFSYSLSNGQTNTTGVFEDLPAGTYTLEVSNGTACIQTVQLTIEEPEQLEIDLIDATDPTCDAINGEVIFEITGGVGAYVVTVNSQPLSLANFTFTENSGTYTIQNLAPGSYSIAIADENACTVTDLVVLTNNPGIVIDSNPILAEICEGQVAQLSPDLTVPAGVTPVIRWYRDAATTQQINSSPTAAPDGLIYQISAQGVLSITNLPDGEFTYYMRISGPGICTEVTVATVTVSERPEVVLDVSSISCFGENDGAISIASGHDPSYSYTLSNGQSNSTGDFTDLTPGSYTLEVENIAGCIQTLDFTISEPGDLAINDIDFIHPSCDEDNGQITFEIIGGTPDFTILLNGQQLTDTNFSVIQTGQQFQVKSLGPGVYSIQVTDQNGCSQEALNLFTLVNQPGIAIGSTPVSDEIMLGEVAVLPPNLTVPAGAVFDLIWYFDANATQAITSSPSPAANGVIYQIDGNDVLSIADLAPGTYTYYYEISGSGVCVTVTQATVIVKSPLTADAVTTPVSCFGGNDGTILLENIVGGTEPFSFSLDQINWQASSLFENLPTGTYTVYVRDATVTTGALASFPGIIIATTANPILANDPDLIRSTCDLPNGAIRNLQISGGTGTFTFEWRKNDPVTGDLIPTGTLQGLEDQLPGNYYLAVTDSNGCEQIFEFEISELPDPVYEAMPPLAICLGETAEIRPIFIAPNPPEPTAPTEVRWYKEAGQVGLIASGSDSQNPSISYTIDDSDWINPQLSVTNLPVGVHDFFFYVVCTGQEIKVEVTVYEVPQLVFDATPITCFGDSNGKITAVSGSLPDYTYSVNGNPAITLAALESQSFAAGIYTLEVITPAGCSQLVTVTVEGPDSPLTIADLVAIDPGCGADNGKIRAQITGGWAPYTITLSSGGTVVETFTLANSNLDIDGLSIGIYSLGVVDARGCQISTGTIELKDGPTQILVDNEEVCQGDLVSLVPTLDPPVSQFTILWFYDAAATQPIVSSPNPAADGRTYQISASGVLTISGLPASAAPYQYFASAVGPDVCVGFVARPVVRVNELPVPSAVITSEQCFGAGGTITVTTTGNSTGYQYSLNGTQFQASNVFNVPQGNYSVTVRTPSGCLVVLGNLEVTGPPSPIVAQVVNLTDATCGLNDGVLTLGISGGYGDYQVELIRNSIVVNTATAATAGNVSFADLATGTYSVLVRDAGNCEIRFDNLLEVKDVPTPILVNDETICEGESATLIPSTLNVTSDLEFTWYFDELGTQQIRSGTVGNVTYAIASDGAMTIEGLAASNTPYSYFVMATGSGICRATPEKANVTVNAIPNLRVSNPSIVCDPTGTVDLTAFIEGFNPAVYDYNVVSPSGSALRMDELTAVNLTGDYRVSSSLKGTTCWNQALRIRVIISPSLLVAEFNYLVDLGSGNIFQNESVPMGEDVFFNDITRGNAVLWNWDFGDGTGSTAQNPIHVYDEIGTYKVQLRVVDEIGCVSIYEMELTVLDDFDVIVPNAFTPGGLKNQYFKPEFRGIASMDFYIFNTWGELIYHTTSLEDRGWDGTLNGKETPNGNYVYRGRFVSRGGQVIDKSGVFILIR